MVTLPTTRYLHVISFSFLCPIDSCLLPFQYVHFPSPHTAEIFFKYPNYIFLQTMIMRGLSQLFGACHSFMKIDGHMLST